MGCLPEAVALSAGEPDRLAVSGSEERRLRLRDRSGSCGEVMTWAAGTSVAGAVVADKVFWTGEGAVGRVGGGGGGGAASSEAERSPGRAVWRWDCAEWWWCCCCPSFSSAKTRTLRERAMLGGSEGGLTGPKA